LKILNDFNENIKNLPLTFLICCSRSGSLLLHSLLDGHPEILQIPLIFKFYDFYYSIKSNLDSLNGRDLAEKFIQCENHKPLFDTNDSFHHKSRLGEDKKCRIIIDKEIFSENLKNLLPQGSKNPREILTAIIYAYSSSANDVVRKPKNILVHIHHGDWLFPEALINNSNLRPHEYEKPPFLPDKIISTVRNPADTMNSLKKIVNQSQITEGSKRILFNSYLELLIQDWQRLEIIKKTNIPLKILRLEDIRQNAIEELGQLSKWLKIGFDTKIMTKPTFFRRVWWGDAFSVCNSSIHRPQPLMLPSSNDPDHRFVYFYLNEIIRNYNYPQLNDADKLNKGLHHLASCLSRLWNIKNLHQPELDKKRVKFMQKNKLRT
jgi:hypothetical protein